MSNQEDGISLPPIVRYKHFKGIYIQDTQDYFLCDFYEVRNTDGSIIYRVEAELPNKEREWTIDFEPDGSGSWRRITGDIPPAKLERQLVHYIITICLVG